MSICYECKHRRELPGNCHIACGAAFDASNDPLAALFQIFGSVGRTPLPPANKDVSFSPGIPRTWPGCGVWPSCYDESIVKSCDGFEAKEKA